ncbi:hypothetical protein I7I48_03488 [Histoplasma ohiense]|nr:hypothetical protein I7I48_03488 [Histoplasma ohiense (nom. inval.)]
MADSTDRSRSHTANPSNGPRQPNEQENPFIAIRRYADEQFSALLQSFIGLPSVFSPPSPRDWLYFQGGDPAIRFHRHRFQTQETGVDAQDSQSRIGSRQRSEKCTCGRDDTVKSSRSDGDGMFDQRWLESRRHFEHQFPSSIFESPLENLWPFDPLHFFSFLPRPSFPYSFDFLGSPNSPGWPISYLLFSPYSPLHLERQQNIRCKPHENPISSLRPALVPFHDVQESETPRWREAFEDLLRVENGQDMLNGDVGAVARKEQPKDWVSGMISRGSLGPHWTHVKNGPIDYFNYRYKQSTDEANKWKVSQSDSSNGYGDRKHDAPEEKWLTELDLYEKFLDQANEPSDEESIPLVSPLMGMLIEDRLGRRRRLLEEQRRWHHAAENNDFDNEKGDSDAKSNAASPMKTSQQHSPSPYVTSIITTTARRTLPDGSVQTTITRKKRFSDQTEENNETVHVEKVDELPSQSENNKPQSLGQTNDHGDQKKGGWFWKD